MQLCNSTGINTKVPLNTISMLFILRVYFLNIFTRPGLWCDRVHLSPGDSEFFHHKLLSYQHWPTDLPSDINHFQSLNPFKRTWLCKQTLYNGTIHIFFPPLPPQKLLWETVLHLINFPNMQWFFFSPLNFLINNLDQKKHSKNDYHSKKVFPDPQGMMLLSLITTILSITGKGLLLLLLTSRRHQNYPRSFSQNNPSWRSVHTECSPEIYILENVPQVTVTSSLG